MTSLMSLSTNEHPSRLHPPAPPNDKKTCKSISIDDKVQWDELDMKITPTINQLWSVFKRILLTKARRKDVQKSSDISVYNTINREEVIEIWSRRWYIIHCIMYQRRLQIPITSSLLMVLYTEISELFCTSFRLALVSKILLKTLSECESRIVGRSPNYGLFTKNDPWPL